MTLPVLTQISKSERVQNDHANIFRQARLYSEIRPIFDENYEPSTAVVTHNLKIDYTDSGGQRRVIFFALDNQDLAQLLSTVQREDNKRQGLDKFMSQTGMVARYELGGGS